MAAAAIASFEHWSNYRDFAKFHVEHAKGYKSHLSKAANAKTGKPLSKATIHSRLIALKAFVLWLAGQAGYKSRISYADADYFNPSANDSRIATARREKKVPTIEQIKLVLSKMPTGSDIEKRDRAIIAFTLLTGARDNAIASFSLKHIDLADRQVFQDARDVRTKNRKTFTTFFFRVGDDVEEIVRDWVEHLKGPLLFGPDDPLFPATKVGLTNRGLFGALGLSRSHWKNATAIRRIFKSAFEAAGLPYANPHSFRDTLAQLGEVQCQTPEAFKAWSQNLGHEQVLTTFTSYGAVATKRQGELLSAIGDSTGVEVPSGPEPDPETIAKVVTFLQNRAT
ncbi:site-specific integrase [Hoeflea sp. IMCC20628]|uniref:tyrosine-type recombinase/integrase n=1 Tax=Hoeflea sp. IMCC20628 TaxID=1620421 RepID=UPI001FD99B1A|nr:site-specific integrase [Hoeflea sp. IMCC20628]